MKKYFILSVLSFWSLFSNKIILSDNSVHTAVDIYKTTQLSVDLINKKYGDQLQKIAEIIQSSDSITSEKNFNQMSKLMISVAGGISELGHFSYVSLSPIFYAGDKTIYFTIDVVDQTDKKRLAPFLKTPLKNIPDPDHLVQNWIDYEKTGLDRYYTKKIQPKYKTCPAHHCIFGFDDPAFKKYEYLFNHFVEKDKKQLIAILRNDKNEKKRAAAAYLLAHIKSNHELIKILVPSIRDSSTEVRNNVMRVLGAVLEKNKTADFPINEAITALDFPMITDRNKALYVISSLAEQPRYAHYIARHAKTELMDQLKALQPNVHDFSYKILKKISGKNFGDRDYAAWEQWLKSNKS